MTVTHEAIESAAHTITSGGVVAFPTETVYGLGADALNPDAIRRVFELKGRPATNPLIVHCLGIAHARMFAAEWPDQAHKLVLKHWPGPLTVVVRKNRFIPDIATAGAPTIALRVPANDTARALIKAAGVPLVGPSANRSGTVSPTTAQHVRADFPDIEILDDGPCTTGIESTVVTFTGGEPRILRPGVLGHEELNVAPASSPPDADLSSPQASPGLFTSHYAPRSEVILCTDHDASTDAHHLDLPADPEVCARELYALLRAADAERPERIAITMPTEPGPIWDAIRDRLTRAAAPRRP